MEFLFVSLALANVHNRLAYRKQAVQVLQYPLSFPP